jgi:hypothetical protein
MFVEHVNYPNHAAVHKKMMPDIDPALNSFTSALETNSEQEIAVTISAKDAGTLFVWLSNKQTTPPSAAQVRASGVELPGTETTYTFTGLDHAATYYEWAVATMQGYESDVMASTPATITTDPYTFINNGLLTFTRASVATRVNSTGLMEKVPVNTARLYHDSDTLAQKGLRLEESRTSIFINSDSPGSVTLGVSPSRPRPISLCSLAGAVVYL